MRLPTDPRFIIPPHVFPHGIQVTLNEVRDILININHSPSRLREPTDKASDPPCRYISDSVHVGVGISATAQQVMETVGAAIRATVPVRGVPETLQQGLGKRLVEDDERRPRPGCTGFVSGLEEWKGPLSWRGHRPLGGRESCPGRVAPVFRGYLGR